MRLMSKSEYLIVPKGMKFTGSGKLGLIIMKMVTITTQKKFKHSVSIKEILPKCFPRNQVFYSHLNSCHGQSYSNYEVPWTEAQGMRILKFPFYRAFCCWCTHESKNRWKVCFVCTNQSFVMDVNGLIPGMCIYVVLSVSVLKKKVFKNFWKGWHGDLYIFLQ